MYAFEKPSQRRPNSKVNPELIKTPAFVAEEHVLRHNLRILDYVRKRTGCKMLQALKTWSTWSLFPITREYLDGTEASSLNEARLGYDEFNHEVHVYAPAYSQHEFDVLLEHASTVIFNSFEQWAAFRLQVLEYTQRTGKVIECGLRINPEHQRISGHGGRWDPCAPGSRLGIRTNEFNRALATDPNALKGIGGLHFHVFFDQGLDDLKDVLQLMEQRFAGYIPHMQWINVGGGQTITNDDYDIEGLIMLVNDFQKRHSVKIHMEPGAAIVKDAGVLVSEVLDVVERNDVPYKIAILDMSFNAHTPDFLLSPDLYMPVEGAEIVRDLELAKTHPYLYQLAGGTCVTGDVLSHFHSFKKPLKAGDKVVMKDGLQYNVVQCTNFNGVQRPGIWFLQEDGRMVLLRKFTYKDFKTQMG